MIQIDSPGTWAPGPECLKRSALLSCSRLVLTQSWLITFRTLQHCSYSAAALVCESWPAHLGTTYPAPAKANWFEISLSRRENAENKSLTRAFKVCS